MTAESPRVVLLCRDGCEGRLIANALANEGHLIAVVVERGSTSNRAKVRRAFKVPLLRRPLVLIDLVALAIYSRWLNRSVSNSLGTDAAPWPAGVTITFVDGANDETARHAIDNLAPELLIVSGTSILRDHILEIPTRWAVNIHGGIVPEYRNVHSEFWAIARRDRDHLGVTALHLDLGIDSGDIAFERRLGPPENQLPLPGVKAALARLAASTAVEVARSAAPGELPRAPQPGGGTLRPRPTALDLLRMGLRRGR